MANFPSVLNVFTRPATTDKLNSPSHSGLHNTVSSALGQVEAMIGVVGNASVVGTLSYDVRSPASGGGGHVQWANKGGTGQTSYTKGDILVAQSASVLSKLSIGSADYVLTADSSQSSGVKWAARLTTGVIVPFAGRSVPTGYLLCDGSAVSRATYSGLFAVLAPPVIFSVTIASPAVFTAVGHGLVIGDKISLVTTGALPTGLAANTDYYVIATGLTADDFEVSATRSGAAVDTSGSQSGVHTLYVTNFGKGDGSTTFNVPDLRGYTTYGYKSTDDNFDVINVPSIYSGEKSHVLTVAELAAHTHSVDAYGLADENQIATGGGDALASSGATAASTGSNTAHNNMTPYVVTNYIIAT